MTATSTTSVSADRRTWAPVAPTHRSSAICRWRPVIRMVNVLATTIAATRPASTTKASRMIVSTVVPPARCSTACWAISADVCAVTPETSASTFAATVAGSALVTRFTVSIVTPGNAVSRASGAYPPSLLSAIGETFVSRTPTTVTRPAPRVMVLPSCQ